MNDVELQDKTKVVSTTTENKSAIAGMLLKAAKVQTNVAKESYTGVYCYGFTKFTTSVDKGSRAMWSFCVKGVEGSIICKAEFFDTKPQPGIYNIGFYQLEGKNPAVSFIEPVAQSVNLDDTDGI